MRAARRWAMAVLPALVTATFLALPSRQFHWDTLERAYLLEHPARYMRTWDGSPRSQFLSFAHPLELPLAWAVGWLRPGASGLERLVLLEALAAGAAVAVVGELVRFWNGAAAGAVLGQAGLAASFAFWKMGSSGEEKVLALASQLLFLLLFWRALATGRGAAGAGAALAFAVLAHLTGAVLVPFAALALAAPPDPWRARRRTVARALGLGAAVAAAAYVAVAAATTGARDVASLWRYATFFHREDGNNFFELTGAAADGAPRLVRAAAGLGSFFAGPAWLRVAAPVALAGCILLRARSRNHASAALATLRRHAAILAALWAAHFVFYEPRNHESWTLAAALLLLVAAASLPRRRAAWLAAVVPIGLAAASAPHYAAQHRPLDLEAYARIVRRDTRPGDIVLLVGGMHGGKPLRGSLSMRYFLAHERERPLVSLYDVLGVTQREYWDRPYTSPAALQAEIDAGRRVFVPGLLVAELDRARAAGLVHIETAARGDSLVQIVRMEAR